MNYANLRKKSACTPCVHLVTPAVLQINIVIGNGTGTSIGTIIHTAVDTAIYAAIGTRIAPG